MTGSRWFFWMVVLGVVLGCVAMSCLAAADPRQLCTWDISYYILGEKDRKVSKQAWMLTMDQQAQLFGPFVSGNVYVEPGKAAFTCDGKTTHIITAPLPHGSLLLLK